MCDLIAIAYPGETTAIEAAQEAERLSHELIVQPDAIASISCNREGTYRVVTNHHQVGESSTWGGFWGLLFGMLFFVPMFGLALGAGLGALLGRLERSGIEREFQEQVRDLLRPGTSALFMMIERVTPEQAAAVLGTFGGTVVSSPLSKETEAELQDALHGHVVAAV